MITRRHTAGHLNIDDAIAESVAPHQLTGNELQHRARTGLGDAELGQRAIQTVKMKILVDQDTVDEGHHLVDSVGKLVTAVFDMNRGIAVGQEAPVDIGLAWQGSGPPLLF